MTSSPELRRWLGFSALAMGVAVANIRTVQGLISLSRADDTASHIVLVPVVSAALLYRLRRSLTPEATFDWLGGALLLAGLALSWTARSADTLSAAASGVALSWVGAFVLVFGRRAAWHAGFPLAYLLLMIPPPSGWLAAATGILKAGSAEAVAQLFAVAHIPFHREGFVFALPAVVIEIADQCSGIRSSIALVSTGLVAAHLMLSRTWTKTVLMSAIVPVAVLKNAIRIVTLSALALYVDPAYLEGRLHHEGGVVFLVIGLAMLGPILLMLQRFESVDQRPRVIAATSR